MVYVITGICLGTLIATFMIFIAYEKGKKTGFDKAMKIFNRNQNDEPKRI